MVTFISSIGACVSRLTNGKRLRQKYLNQLATGDHLDSIHKEGFAWGDMDLLCADWKTMDLCGSATARAQRKLPYRLRKRSGP